MIKQRFARQTLSSINPRPLPFSPKFQKAWNLGEEKDASRKTDDRRTITDEGYLPHMAEKDIPHLVDVAGEVPL